MSEININNNEKENITKNKSKNCLKNRLRVRVGVNNAKSFNSSI